MSASPDSTTRQPFTHWQDANSAYGEGRIFFGPLVSGGWLHLSLFDDGNVFGFESPFLPEGAESASPAQNTEALDAWRKLPDHYGLKLVNDPELSINVPAPAPAEPALLPFSPVPMAEAQRAALAWLVPDILRYDGYNDARRVFLRLEVAPVFGTRLIALRTEVGEPGGNVLTRINRLIFIGVRGAPKLMNTKSGKPVSGRAVLYTQTLY